MDVHHARAFLALADELHFGRAAARLHIAQPPLSRLIRQLEDELEAPLFERSTRAVSLTPQGEALVEPARELVMLSQRMKEIVRQAGAGETGRVRLGFAGASVNHLVAQLARALRRERPGLAVELHSAQLSRPGLERLLDGSLDVLIGRWDFLPADVDSRVIAREQLLVAVPTSHRLAQRRELTAADVADEPWIVLPGGSGATLSDRLHLLGQRGRFVPRIVQTAPDSATELLLVDRAAARRRGGRDRPDPLGRARQPACGRRQLPAARGRSGRGRGAPRVAARGIGPRRRRRHRGVARRLQPPGVTAPTPSHASTRSRSASSSGGAWE
ncbi:LysR family transcriptional regulator [Microbacterium sp. SS28]|uniref:LysR family transcriptional regulator n=1 Tax=Microbacterium sp. SS28 TaxID=2919948 RepID=UPI001FA95ED8|nr:LysR substrate-binding domain-containing protein [Microbacterium sp. SS28]